MSRVSDDEIEAMLAGLEGVTPGPWECGARQDGARQSDRLWDIGSANEGVTSSLKRTNAEHVRRCDPDTMRSILTELRTLRQALEAPNGQ